MPPLPSRAPTRKRPTTVPVSDACGCWTSGAAIRKHPPERTSSYRQSRVPGGLFSAAGRYFSLLSGGFGLARDRGPRLRRLHTGLKADVAGVEAVRVDVRVVALDSAAAIIDFHFGMKQETAVVGNGAVAYLLLRSEERR